MLRGYDWLRWESERRERNYRRWFRIARRAVLELAS